MSDKNRQQKEICIKNGSSYVVAEPSSKLGIAIDSLNNLPLNALRHIPAGDTCGWYIWGGEELSDDVDYFKPLRVSHIKDHCPEIEKYLGLAPGWRVLLAGEQEEVWFDEKLLDTD